MKAELTVNLGIIKDNYSYLQSVAKSKVGAAIKSDAYGLGAKNVTPALFEAGCRDFFVAHIEEGIDARNHLLSLEANIYVLNGFQIGAENIFAEYNLIPALSNLSQIEIWNKLEKKGKSIIHFDTGMNRLGLSKECLASLKALPEGTEYIISHLACDGDITNPYNKSQLDEFIKYTAAHKVKQSLAASGGIFLGPEYHFDMVRPGAALYGIGSDKNPNLKNPITLTAQIIHIKHCNDDVSVGYDRTGYVKAGSTLATIALGYADGFFRSLGNRGFIFINGIKVPIIGTLSMDLTVLDVTGVNCNIGDEVEIIGPNNTPDQIAHITNTIGYEVTTSLKAGRYNRLFI